MESIARPYKSSAPYTFPRGEGGTAPAVTDEECGQKPGDKYTVSDFFPYPTFRRSSPAPFGGTLPPGEGIGRQSMTAPTRAAHRRVCHREGRQARGDLPVQFYDHIGTNVEATPYREIPTDGIAVLGMTCFYMVAHLRISHYFGMVMVSTIWLSVSLRSEMAGMPLLWNLLRV